MKIVLGILVGLGLGAAKRGTRFAAPGGSRRGDSLHNR